MCIRDRSNGDGGEGGPLRAEQPNKGQGSFLRDIWEEILDNIEVYIRISNGANSWREVKHCLEKAEKGTISSSVLSNLLHYVGESQYYLRTTSS